MKPLTLAEVNAAIDRENKRIAAATGEPEPAWDLYGSADQPYYGCLRMTLLDRHGSFVPRPVSLEIDRLADNLGAMPIGFAIARVNRILETIPEPEGVEA